MASPRDIKCVVFDYANTLSSDHFFQTHPRECADWIPLFQQRLFANESHVTDWCTGKLSTRDVARMMQPHIDMSVEWIIAEMHRGCTNLTFNRAVMDFALSQRALGRRTALVTENLDIFTTVVVPHYGLDRVFDAVVNSADYRCDGKLGLWPIAFRLLGAHISYANSLLVDDSDKWLDAFRACGGLACKYTNDLDFAEWLLANGFSERGHRNTVQPSPRRTTSN